MLNNAVATIEFLELGMRRAVQCVSGDVRFHQLSTRNESINGRFALSDHSARKGKTSSPVLYGEWRQTPTLPSEQLPLYHGVKSDQRRYF